MSYTIEKLVVLAVEKETIKLNEKIKELESIIKENNNIIERKNGELKNNENELNKIIKEKDNIIEEKDNIIEENYNIIQEQDNIIKVKDNIIKEKNNIIKEKNNIIQEKNNELKNNENELNKIKNTLYLNKMDDKSNIKTNYEIISERFPHLTFKEVIEFEKKVVDNGGTIKVHPGKWGTLKINDYMCYTEYNNNHTYKSFIKYYNNSDMLGWDNNLEIIIDPLRYYEYNMGVDCYKTSIRIIWKKYSFSIYSNKQQICNKFGRTLNVSSYNKAKDILILIIEILLKIDPYTKNTYGPSYCSIKDDDWELYIPNDYDKKQKYYSFIRENIKELNNYLKNIFNRDPEYKYGVEFTLNLNRDEKNIYDKKLEYIEENNQLKNMLEEKKKIINKQNENVNKLENKLSKFKNLFTDL